MSFRSQLMNVVEGALEKELGEISDSARLYDLCLESIKGTPEEGNAPSPRDGIRPTSILTIVIMLEVEDVFGINIRDEETEGIETFGQLAELVGEKLKAIQDDGAMSANS